MYRMHPLQHFSTIFSWSQQLSGKVRGYWLYCWNAKYDIFAEVRGKGLLIGAELTEKYAGKAKDFLNASMEEGLMILVAGPNVIRLTPSLVIPDTDIAEALARFEKAVAKIA